MIKLNENEVDKITKYLIDTVFRNSDIIFDESGDYTGILLDIIASLHNLLYSEVKGYRYDYMFHWYNKVTGSVDINDDMFDNLIKEVRENGNNDQRNAD